MHVESDGFNVHCVGRAGMARTTDTKGNPRMGFIVGCIICLAMGIATGLLSHWFIKR